MRVAEQQLISSLHALGEHFLWESQGNLDYAVVDVAKTTERCGRCGRKNEQDSGLIFKVNAARMITKRK